MLKKFLLPIGLVVAGIGLSVTIIATGPTLNHLPPPPNEPVLRTWEAQPETVRMSSFTHGSVMPRTESELIPEVSGRVINMSGSLISGGFFAKGDMLLEIDPLDYEVALSKPGPPSPPLRANSPMPARPTSGNWTWPANNPPANRSATMH